MKWSEVKFDDRKLYKEKIYNTVKTNTLSLSLSPPISHTNSKNSMRTLSLSLFFSHTHTQSHSDTNPLFSHTHTGKRTVRVKEVPLASSSLCQGDVFILDAGLKIFIFNGPSANMWEKAKGKKKCFCVCMCVRELKLKGKKTLYLGVDLLCDVFYNKGLGCVRMDGMRVCYFTTHHRANQHPNKKFS